MKGEEKERGAEKRREWRCRDGRMNTTSL